MRQLRPWIVRQCAVPVVSHYLYRLMALHRRLGRQAAASGPRPILAPAYFPIEDVFSKKVAAMALYGSQFRAFFSNREACASSLISYSKSMRPGASSLERYWNFLPPA